MADQFTHEVPGNGKKKGYMLFALVVFPDTVVAKWDVDMRAEMVQDASAVEIIVNILKDQIRLLEEENAALNKPQVVN